jgi:hypothetical protein
MTRAWLLIAALAACTNDSYLVVTVNARPAVHDAKTLAVTLGNGGTMLTRQLTLGAHSFPLTFSVDATGRSGELDLTVEADDDMGLPVGLGSGSATVGASEAAIQLDSADFAVNTDYAMDQYLTFDYDSNGLQVAAAPDGTWFVGYRDNCNGSGMCNVYGRKFDATGAPATTVSAAGTNAFQLTTTLSDVFTDPAIVTSGTQTVAVWNYTDSVGMGHGVACRTIDPMGDAGAGQLSVSTDSATIISAGTFSNGNLALVWELGLGIPPTAAIRALIIKPDCTTTNTVATVSQTTGTTTGPTSPNVAANGANALYAWIVDGDVYVRTGTSNGVLGAAESKLIAHTATQSATSVRLAPSGSGFAMVVRWVHPTQQTSPGKIEVFQLTSAGALSGSPTLITDQSRSDYVSGEQSTSVAVRANDGAILVAWHACDSAGTTGTCDVFGRMVRPNGTTSGEAFVLSSNAMGDQTQPAVASLPGADNAFAAVWTDTSHDKPDQQGSAVRGRILYPAYDPNGSN